MLQRKREEIARDFRRRKLELTIEKCRQRELGKVQLKQLLVEYKKCALVNGDKDYLNHTEYLHCESFAFFTHSELYRLIVEIGVQQAKQLLIEESFPSLLQGVMELIEEKTLEYDDDLTQILLKSRNQVLESISDLASLISQDYELIAQFGKSAPALFVKQLNRTMLPGRPYQIKEYNAIIGLCNLFNYQGFKDQVYDELEQSNFLFFIDKMLRNFMSKQEVVGDKELFVCIVTLLRYFLEHQENNKTKVLSPVFQKTVGRFVGQTVRQNLVIDHEIQEDSAENELIDELLIISLYIKPRLEEHIGILKCPELFKKLTYMKLLNFYTSNYSTCVGLSLFGNQELSEMFQSAKELEKTPSFSQYLKQLASALANMLQYAKDTQKQAIRIWTLLDKTKSAHLFFDCPFESQDVTLLTTMLDCYQPEEL